MEYLWDDILSQQDKDVIINAGYDRLGAASWESRKLGKSPVLLIIDMQKHLIGEDEPILKAVKKERTAMGEIAWRAMRHIDPFVALCREAKIPIYYTRVIPNGRTSEADSIKIIPEMEPKAGDIVLDKNYSSAFYGTSLLTHLTRAHIDTIIVVGNSTSGCVRATAVDARQMGFNVLIPQECTFDRIEASHKVSLLDMWMKYASVLPITEASQYVQSFIGNG